MIEIYNLDWQLISALTVVFGITHTFVKILKIRQTYARLHESLSGSEKEPQIMGVAAVFSDWARAIHIFVLLIDLGVALSLSKAFISPGIDKAFVFLILVFLISSLESGIQTKTSR